MKTSLPTFIELFAATKQTEGKSPRTVQWYREFLTRFSVFAGDPPLSEVGVEMARSFVASLQEKTQRYVGHPKKKAEAGKLSAHTVHAYVRAIKAFGSWLFEEGFTPNNIFARLKRPKTPETIIEILSDEEIRKLTAAINPNTLLGARLAVIVLVLLDTGIRANELCTLKLADTHLDQGYLKVLGKRNKERIVPISAATKKAILRYLNTFRPETRREELIVSLDGEPMTPTSLFHAIKRLARKTGIERLHPHLFRHTMAVNYIMGGGDIVSLKLMLGHTSLETVQLYLHLAEAHVKIQHARFSVVERLGLGITARRSGRGAAQPRVIA